ncbi:MAG: GNAT family N-acetyltransferase [Gammaproteobacteria bacterium]
MADLEAINRVVESAVMTWRVSDRVKRLALPSYRYSGLDLTYLQLVVAENAARRLTGAAAWERAADKDAPPGRSALLLHGIYVDPAYHRCGIGRELLSAAEQAVHRHRHDGLLVKAQQDASGFFVAQGMIPLPASDPLHQYDRRFWKDLTGVRHRRAQAIAADGS